jgi:HAD superfamily hydrolase (TIGR01509 family)
MRAIFFDFGGTLDFPRHWLDRFVTHYQAAGLEIDRTELDRAFSLATQEAYGCSAVLRNYSLSQLVGFLVELQFKYLAGHSAAAVHDLLAHGSAEGITNARTQIRDAFVAESMVGLGASRPLLASLARNVKIAVVSNFYGNLDRVIAEADLARAVTATADSGLLGFYKPDPRIFTASLAQLEVQPHHAVMVGDSISKDCAPAHALGMTTVWLRHREFNGHRAPSLPAPDFTIDQLDELKDFGWLDG